MRTVDRSCVALVFAIVFVGVASLAFADDDPRSARAIMEQARAGRPEDAAAIVKALGPSSPRRIAELRLLLRDQDAFIRRAAVLALSGFGDRPLQALVRLLDDDDKGVRAAAEQALGAAGAPAVEVLGEVLLTHSCLSESFKAAVRILGAIGDEAGAPYLANALVKYRKGGFPQRTGMEALARIGGPPAVAQLLQLTDYRELGQEAYLALMGLDRDALMRTVATLLADASTDPQLRIAYALQLNEIAGTVAAAPALVAFFQSLADAADLPPEIRKKAATFKNLFARIDEDATLFRKPLTEPRLNGMFADRREDEESPFIEARREQERKMDEIRSAREAEKQRRAGVRIIGPYLRSRIFAP